MEVMNGTDIGQDIINTLNIKLDKEKVNVAVEQIKQMDLNSVKTVGTEVQQKISTSVSKITDRCRTLDCGEAGKALVSLKVATDVDLSSSWLEKKFFGAKRTYTSFVSKYQKASTNLQSIVDKVGDYKEQLEGSFDDLAQLVDVSKQSFYELEYYVEAFKECAKEQEYSCSNLEPNSLEYLGKQQTLQVYRRRLETLQASRVVLYQTVKESMLLMITNRTLIDDMQYTVDNIIPLWQAQMITATNAEIQKNALGINKAVRESFNKMLVDNAKRISNNAVDIMNSSNESIISIEALNEVESQLNGLTKRLQDNYIKTSDQYLSSIKKLDNLVEEGRVIR